MPELEKIINKICEHSKTSADEVKKLIEEKQDELSGLVSAEGAAYIVGRELGVSLLKESKRALKVKSLVSGLRSVNLVLKIANIGEPREFTKNNKSGKVLNLLVGDETGLIRISLWNDEVDLAKELHENDIIQITGGYVKQDNRGQLELRVGRGKIQPVKEAVSINLPPKPELQSFATAKRKVIKDLQEGDYAAIRASMVQIFKRRPFYTVCPTCGGRVEEKEGKFICSEHKEVEPDYHMVISGILDDGTENIRAVFFRNLAEQMFGSSTKELREIAQKETDQLKIYDNFDKLAQDLIFFGRVKKNNITESLEFVVNDIKPLDVKKECQNLLETLK